MSNEELNNIVGGFNISASFLNALLRGLNSLLELGRSIGSAIRRGHDGNVCKI